MNKFLPTAIIFILLIMLGPFLVKFIGLIFLIGAIYVILTRLGLIGNRSSTGGASTYRDASKDRGSDQLRRDDLITSDHDAEVVNLPESALRKDDEHR